MFPGTVTLGAVVSWTTTSNGAAPRLPWLSVAKQSMCVSPTGNGPGEAGVHVAGIVPSTASVAVIGPNGTEVVTPVASATMSAGTLIAGGFVSRTIALKETLALLPEASVAEHVTGVVPIGYGPAGRHETGRAPSTRSGAVGGVDGAGVL